MVVAMGIAAILMALGIGGLISARTSSQVDAVAEDLVSTIRQAQNNAISIKEGGCTSTEGSTKLWRVRVGNNDYKIQYFCGLASGSLQSAEKDFGSATLSPYPSVQITTPVADIPSSVYFTTPFGRGFTFSGYGSDFMEDKNDPAKQWGPKSILDSTSTEPKPETSDLTWTVTQNGYARKVILKPNGDVYEQ